MIGLFGTIVLSAFMWTLGICTGLYLAKIVLDYIVPAAARSTMQGVNWVSQHVQGVWNRVRNATSSTYHAGLRLVHLDRRTPDEGLTNA